MPDNHQILEEQKDADLVALEAEPEPKPAFRIDTPARADWYVKKLGALADEEARVRGQMERILNRISRDREGLEYRFTGELRAWAESVLGPRESRKKHYIDLPHGRVKLALPVPKVEVEPDAKLPDEFLRHVPERWDPDKRKIMAHIKATGEVPQGCDLVPGHEAVKVELKARDED